MDGVLMSEAREKIAKAIFNYWIAVKQHMFSVAIEIPTAGILIIDTKDMEEWAVLCDRTYDQLRPAEKETFLEAVDEFLAAFSLPPVQPRYETLRSNVQYWNLRDQDGKDVGDLHPGAKLEVIGEDDTRYRVVGWAHKGGFE